MGDDWDTYVRKHYTKKMGSHVTEPPRFYLTTLFFMCILLVIACLILIFDIATQSSLEVLWKFVYVGIFLTIPLWIVSFYIPYNQETSKAPVGQTKNGSIFTFRLEDISDLVPVTDESEDGLERQSVYMRWLPKNAVPGWPYAYGGGNRGYLIVCQAHIRYKLEEDEKNNHKKWVIDNAWSLNLGEIIVNGKYYMRHIDEDGNVITQVMENYFTTRDLTAKFSDDKPYKQTGLGKFIFPFDNVPINHAEVPAQLIGDDEHPKGIRLHSRFKKSSPVDIGWDLATEFGGPGMNLPSHADFRFGANERQIKEASIIIADQRTGLTTQERLTLDKLKKEREEWEKANR